MRTRAGWVIGLLVAVLTLAGCGANDDQGNSPVDQAAREFAELMQRPDIDQAVARYQQLYTEIRDRLSAMYPGLVWSRTLEPTRAACGDGFVAVDGGRAVDDAVTTSLGNWDTSAPVPEAQWEQALAVVTSAARRYGFAAPKVLLSHAGAHEANLTDRYHAVLTFGMGNGLGLTFVTGCHLTAAAKRRGHIAPTPTY